MFLHLSVSHSVHRGGGRAWQEGMHGGWACMVGGVRSRGGMCGRGACMVGGVCGRGWACMAGGACVVGGVHAMHAPSHTLRDTVGQCAGGTHPTGMHSC